MDPIGALIIACLVATGVTKRWFGDGWDKLRGRGTPRHDRLMQDRQHAHERRMQADKLRHTEHMAGKGRPTVQDAFADRIRRGPKPYTEMGGVRRWWFDLCADRAEHLTRERRAREERRRNGEQEWQRFGRWARARWQRAGEEAARRWQERHATQDPHGRIWADSERTDIPTPNVPDPGVDDRSTPGPTPKPITVGPDGPRFSADPSDPNGTKDCPTCGGSVVKDGGVCPSCQARQQVRNTHWDNTTNRDGWVGRGPTHPAPRPVAAGLDDRTGGRVSTGRERLLIEPYPDQGPEPVHQPPPPIRAIAERIHAITGGTAAMAEIFNPESAIADATTLESEADGLVSALDQRIGELDANNITGEPRDAYAAMQEAAVTLRDAATAAVACFTNHQAIQDHVRSDESIGNGQYLEID